VAAVSPDETTPVELEPNEFLAEFLADPSAAFKNPSISRSSPPSVELHVPDSQRVAESPNQWLVGFADCSQNTRQHVLVYNLKIYC
jgi:hypothetical protein